MLIFAVEKKEKFPVQQANEIEKKMLTLRFFLSLFAEMGEECDDEEHFFACLFSLAAYLFFIFFYKTNKYLNFSESFFFILFFCFILFPSVFYFIFCSVCVRVGDGDFGESCGKNSFLDPLCGAFCCHLIGFFWMQ